MPIRLKSPNHIDPTFTFTAFLISVLVGARRFAHANLLRGDRALHALLGMTRFPTDDTIRNLFRRFGMGQVQRLFEPLTDYRQAAVDSCHSDFVAVTGGEATVHDQCVSRDP